jgi:hypothetical protein
VVGLLGEVKFYYIKFFNNSRYILAAILFIQMTISLHT